MIGTDELHLSEYTPNIYLKHRHHPTERTQAGGPAELQKQARCYKKAGRAVPFPRPWAVLYDERGNPGSLHANNVSVPPCSVRSAVKSWGHATPRINLV